MQVQALGIGKIRWMKVCELSKRKFHVAESLKFHLKNPQTREGAVTLIQGWIEDNDIRYELAHDLQEALAAATGLPQCGSCHWVTTDRNGCCDDNLTVIEPIDD